MKRVIIFLLLIIIISSSLPVALALPEAVLVMEEIIKMPPLPTIDHGIIMDPFTILEEEIPLDNPLIYIPELKLQAFIREILGMKKYYPIKYKHLLMLGGTLDLTGLELTNLGGLEYATNLTGIIADGSKQPYIPLDLNIKYLSINNCGLTQLPEALNSMENLEYLSAENNMLTEIDPEIFKQKLQYLSLRGNNIPTIPEEIVNASDMIYLDLGNCNVSELADISVMTNLKALDISYSDLGSLPEFITNSSLEALYVSGCDFNIKDFTPPAMIKYLDVSSNQTLYSLTDAIINLEELVYLNISDLGLMALPLKTSWHYSINYLDISDNQIEILPYAFHSVDIFIANRNLFGQLPLLTGNYMDFRANRLTDMPEFAGNLIMLDYNMISGAEDQLIKPSTFSVKVVDGIINLKFSPTSQRDGNMSLLGYRILKNDEVLDILIKTTTSWQGGSVLPGEIHRIRVETINVINDDDLGKFNLSDGRNGIASLPAPPTPKPTPEPTPEITPIPSPEPTKRFPIPWIPLIWYFSPAYVIIVIGIIIALIRRGK